MAFIEGVENFMIIAILQAEISIISFGEKMQRRTKAAHNEQDIFCLILKNKKKEELKERKKT